MIDCRAGPFPQRRERDLQRFRKRRRAADGAGEFADQRSHPRPRSPADRSRIASPRSDPRGPPHRLRLVPDRDHRRSNAARHAGSESPPSAPPLATMPVEYRNGAGPSAPISNTRREIDRRADRRRRRRPPRRTPPSSVRRRRSATGRRGWWRRAPSASRSRPSAAAPSTTTTPYTPSIAISSAAPANNAVMNDADALERHRFAG